MTRAAPSIGFWMNVRFNLGFVIPNILQGTFRRKRGMVWLMSLLQRDPAAVRFANSLRRRFPGHQRFYVRLVVSRALLTMDQLDVERILEHSPDTYGPPKAKRDGMGIFQPHAVNVSVGAEWRERRAFNDAVLAADEDQHPFAPRFQTVVREEVERCGWPTAFDGFSLMFERIMLRVVFGDEAAGERRLAMQLSQLMGKANRIFGLRKPPLLDQFLAGIRVKLQQPGVGSLAARSMKQQPDAPAWVASQVVHWMFALKDTLPENVLRALALLAVHPKALATVKSELDGGIDTATIGNGTYLDGCVQEGMRLWPTTPMIVREALRGDVLGDDVVAKGLSVAFINTFNHRDTQAYADANRFVPEQWKGCETRPLVNHLSGGRQFCAGRRLARLLARCVIAEIVSRNELRLTHPRLDPERLPYSFNHFRARFG